MNTEAARENNLLTISGKACSKPYFTHTSNGVNKIRYYEFTLESKRTSGVSDFVKVMISEELTKNIDFNRRLILTGEVRTCNVDKHLHMYLFAKTIGYFEIEEVDINRFQAVTYICKTPVIRETPSKRIITDLTLACIRPYLTRSDYFPCITWGAIAKKASSLEVSTKLYINARFQSRYYSKVIDTIVEQRIAYEVSINEFEVIE